MINEYNTQQEAVTTMHRETDQYLMPLKKYSSEKSKFDLYPSYDLGANKIFSGYTSLIKYLTSKKVVCLDGFSGIHWDLIIEHIAKHLTQEGKTINLINFSDNLKSETEIETLVAPFLGTEESVWGKRCTLTISNFFVKQKIKDLQINEQADINIIYGSGASLVNFDHTLVYFDLPKNEIQYRMRAGSISNFGLSTTQENFKAYKHYYFVDWVILNAEKQRLAQSIEVMVDAQHDQEPSWAMMKDLRKGLQSMSTTLIQVRPWFEPGTWGGDWIKENIEGLNKEVINYAWAFSLIVPENGLIFKSDDILLEISFDFLMNQEFENVLGDHHKIFGTEFPIRFNFLDTFNGGNLSVQCHPSLDYIKKNFGESITQDECYYILDCDNKASVYLGFQENIDPKQFKADLVRSTEENKKLNITDYVQQHKSARHDMYLIPNGTVHSAGAGNMVLEISATPYIFTFKMYDWLRLDLNGKPRPINIDHAFNNLRFEFKGDTVAKELLSHTERINSGDNFEIIHYPTHADHFYDVRRLDFDASIDMETCGSCQVMMLVEGESIMVKSKNGHSQKLHFAETFIIPAAAQSFKLTNLGTKRAKVVNAFLK